MPYIELDEQQDGRIAIQSEYRERDLIKQVPGKSWDKDRKIWTCPRTWAACIQLRGIFGKDLQVGPRLAQWSQFEYRDRVYPALTFRQLPDAEVQGGVTHADKLFPFQRAGVNFLLSTRFALMADEMGTGKTVQAAAAVEAAQAFPLLVVCPNSMKQTWANELLAWNPSAKPVVVRGTKKKRMEAFDAVASGRANVLIINWESLRLHSSLARFGNLRLDEKQKEPKELNVIPWKAVIADEAHRGKDPKAQSTRALWAVGQQDTVEYRWALTGTPVANNPVDLWSIMHFVDPQEFPGKTAFIERYGLQSWNAYGYMTVEGLRPETRDEFFSILDPRFIRRPKAAVLPQLPPKVYSKRYVEMDPKQRKPYEQMAKTMLAELDAGIHGETDVVAATNPLARLTRLLQFASATGEFVGPEEDRNLRLTAPSCKVDALMEVAEEMGDRQAVVFAESKQLINLAYAELIREERAKDGTLTKKGYRCALITGDVNEQERQKNVEAFQRGEIQFLLLTLGAGGEGLTLTAADAAIFLQRSFSLIKNLQAEDRIHRPGQDANKVEIIDLITENTIESKVHATMVAKEGKLEEVVRDAATIRTWLQKAA